MAQSVEERNPFSTDPSDELPVGLQLSWRLRALIATGSLAPGERLPSFRRLADWAGVNLNTVRAVYEALEEEGLVISRHGRGTFVADSVQPAPGLEEIAADALHRAREAGLSPRELTVVVAVSASMADLGPAGTASDAPEAPELAPAEAERSADVPDLAEDSETLEIRHELRQQIARLEAELASYAPYLPDLPTAPRRAKGHVAGVEELEQTRDTLIAKLSEAQKTAAQRAREAGRARVQRREVLEAEQHGDAREGSESPLARAVSRWLRRS